MSDQSERLNHKLGHYQRRRAIHCVGLLMLLVMLLSFPLTAPALAQQSSGASICVLAYEDANRNKARDPGEVQLADVAVSLLVNNVIIANHVTNDTETFCFRDLAPTEYTVAFASPLYQGTSVNAYTSQLGAGEPRVYEFGAVRLTQPGALPSQAAGPTLSDPLRLALSAGAAITAMILLTGLGFIFYGLFAAPRRKPKS